jgi:hypothetical protein
VLVVVAGDRVGSEDQAIDIAFDINVASDLYTEVPPRSARDLLTAQSVK